MVCAVAAPVAAMFSAQDTIASFDPVNPQIADAIRQREHARIMEQTEALIQRARIAATKVRLNADEEIALLENGQLEEYNVERESDRKNQARLKKELLDTMLQSAELFKIKPFFLSDEF